MIKTLLGVLGAAAAVLGAPAPLAAAYPERAITLVIPVAPGDATDVAARIMAEGLSKALKVPVVPVNKPGAGGLVGTDSVVKGPKDGYTILFTINASLTSNRILNPQTASYDPIKDLIPLGLTTRTPMVIAARSDAPFKTFKELVAYARQNPGKVNIGTAGAGSIGDFAVRIINAQAGTDMVMVPFKGAAPSMTAVQGGHVDGVAAALGLAASHLKAGTMRALVTSTRSPQFPDIQTMSQLGYGQDYLGVWLAFFAPAGAPAEAVQILVPAIEAVARDPEVTAKLASLGVVQDYRPPAKLQDEIVVEHRTISEIVARAGTPGKQ